MARTTCLREDGVHLGRMKCFWEVVVAHEQNERKTRSPLEDRWEAGIADMVKNVPWRVSGDDAKLTAKGWWRRTWTWDPQECPREVRLTVMAGRGIQRVEAERKREEEHVVRRTLCGGRLIRCRMSVAAKVSRTTGIQCGQCCIGCVRRLHDDTERWRTLIIGIVRSLWTTRHRRSTSSC